MPRIVKIPGVAELSFPDDLGEDAMLEATKSFYEQSKQGAIGAASSAAVREPARQVGGAMKALSRLGDWFQPPDYNPETGDPIWQKAESTFFGPETTVPVEKPAPVPIEQTGLYQAGESLQRGAEKMFPVNPLRSEDFLTQVGSGIGSLPTSIIPYAGPLIYAASAGEDAAEKAGRFYDNKISEAMASGNRAEADRLQEEKKYQQALQFGINAPLGYATERFMGVVPGLKKITEGGGKLLPKLVAGQAVDNTKKVATFLTKQGLKTAGGEFLQEGSEQVGGNIGEKFYNPDAEFTSGVLDASAAGGAVGFLASVPLNLLGSKLRKNRLDKLQEFRDTRLAEGPLSGQQVSEINKRIVLGQPLTEGEPGAFLSLLSDDPSTQSSVGGNNAELLPNATATLAGINSGGAPSGRISITPPEEGLTIPEMQLETEAAGEEATQTPVETVAPVGPITQEATDLLSKVDAGGVPMSVTANLERIANENGITVTGADTPNTIISQLRQKLTPTTTENAVQEQGAGQSLLRAEKPQPEVQMGLSEVDQGGRPAEGAGAEIQTEVQPLTIEETNEYNRIVDLLNGASAYDMLEEEQLNRFEELAGRVGELERAGFDFDETTGWTKPGVTPAATAPVAPTIFPEETTQVSAEQQEMERLRKIFTGPPRPLSVPETVVPAPAPAKPRSATSLAEIGEIGAATGENLRETLWNAFSTGQGPKITSEDPVVKNAKIVANKTGATIQKADFLTFADEFSKAQNPADKIAAMQSLANKVSPARPTPPTRTVVLTPGAVTVTQTPVKPTPPVPAPAPAPSTISDENQTLLKNIGIIAKSNADGTISLSGGTFRWKDDIKEFGGRFADKSWRISADGFGKFIERARPSATVTVGQPGGRPAYVADSGLRKLRADADNRPDRSGLDGGVGNYVGEDTQQLIRQGEAFGIPSIVIDEQIEDVALMVQAYRQGRPLFMLSSAPGTGKTFVLGAAIRELRRSGAKKITYVTLRKELITQIKQDLKDYDIGDVNFITYAEMKDRPAEASDVLIFDEAHAIKNLSGDGSEQAKKAQEWMSQTKFPVLSTATPFENPVQAAYLASTGIFESFGGFKNFALAYGATSVNTGNDTILVWRRTNTSDADQVAARNFFKKEGIFTARKTRLPKDQVDSRLVKVTADSEYTKMYTEFEKAVEENKGSLAGFSKAWIKNFQKRILEASKINIAINEASNALKAGRWPIIFVETKAERKIDIPRLIDLEAQWRRETDLARRMNERGPSRAQFGLPPMGITDVLASFMEETGISVIEIPSAEDTIKAKFGEDNVAIFTGSVTPAKAQKNLDKWRGNKPMVLVATMAKGGTGLSLHDKVGNHQTTQINVNLPWTATQVEQVSLRSARYGLKGIAQMQWLFADNIPFDRELAQRVGSRMADMGALVHGELPTTAASIQNWNFEDDSFSEANADQADKNDLIKQEQPPTPPVAPTPAPEPAAPPVTAPKKRYKAREWASKGDILDAIISLGGVMSKSQAKKEKRLEKIKDLYDDAPRLDPYFNKIFGGRSRGTASRNQPDQLLAELATENPGKYGDMSVPEFWAEVEKAARGRKGDVVAMKQEAKAAAAGAEEAMGLDAFLQAQDDAFVDSQTEGMQNAGEPDGPVQISVGSLAIGDKFSVQGESFEVTAVTPDGEYTIRDGDKFGVQQLTEYDTLFVDEPPDRGGGDAFEFPTEGPAAPTERKPRLAAGQNQGDLISSTQVEDFALVGEKGVDLEARKQKAQAAARAAAEAKAAQEKAQTQIDLGDAVAEASDAIAQFVESITPKAGITEGPTPEESARRVLEALVNLASVAIRAGVRNASLWATSLQLKLSPALQYAWDRAQGSTVEPTPEVIADVSSLPERVNGSDFGMIYSTPDKPVKTKRGAFEDTVAGRRSRTPEVQKAGVKLAVDAFNEAGIKFRQVADGLFAPVDGVNQEDAGRKLIEVAKAKIAEAKKQGRSDTIAELIQSLRNDFGASEAFSLDTRDELYLIGQSEASEFGKNLASLKASVKDFVAVARNVRGFLTSAIYDSFNGESVKGVMDKIMTEFRGQFTEAEIQKIVGEKPDLQEMLNRFGILALADTGGRVYRTVQARLTTKKPTTQKAKEQRALEDEAIDQIIENALALGVTEPPQPPNRKLTPDERLALMTKPATQAKVQKATEDAVKQAEFNAGWAVMMASAAGNEELSAQYQEAKDAGEEPDPEAIEEGLDLPKYAHWRTIRDGFLNYSPTTLKLAQDVIRGRFKGTQFGTKKVAPPAPAKINLVRLVQSPNAEMSRVIGEQLTAIEGVMDLAGASPEAKARVMQMVTANVGSQIQLARQRVLNNFLDVKAKTGPTTASDSLQRLINAGITEDKRYQSEPTRKLLKRVAKTYLTADELSGMATKTRAEKLAFLTGKLNQITAAENLKDEWMQGAVWTYLTERMMEAENAAVSQIVGAKDVSFDPAQPKTDAQLAADRAKAVDRLAGGIRAGLLDQRIAESVAKNPALQRLVPKMSDLVKRVLNTPQAGQAKLAQAFSEALLAELAIDQALADKTGLALAKAFQVKFERARIQALDLAVKNLTPKQREEVGPGRPLWQKIEEFVNAGGMNSAALLQSIAKKSGWKVPTDEEVSRLRDLARLEQELSTASEEEIKSGQTDEDVAAKNAGPRQDIMREIQMRWARMTMPIRGNKQNLARAINEVTSANLLFKMSFIAKQLMDVATQMFYYTPTRAVGTAVERFKTSRDPNRTTRLWKDTSNALEDAYKARFKALNMALTSALEAAKGRAEKDTIMGIQSGIRALDRLNAQATEYYKKGDYARATVARLISLTQLAFRFASSLDAFQGVLAEQQEIGAWTESQLRLQGMAPELARKTAKTIIGDAIVEYALAQSVIADDPNISPKERRAAAWNVVRSRQYQRIKAAGLDAGALKEITQDLRSTIGWNIEETSGFGGLIGKGMKNASELMAKVGIPNPVGRFSNAIAIGINRALTFAGGGFVPNAFEGSAWYKNEADKVQRKIEAATGLGLSGVFAALVLSGALRVFTRWPDDKEEADLWERDGHKPNTMELDLPDGKILRVSLNTGPIQIVRPALAAIGQLQYEQARRNRLNQKAGAAAKKKGLKFEPRDLTAGEIGWALAYGAWSAIGQGRTASGLIGSGTYRGAPDMGKIAAATVSPLIPFGPLMREATAMSGAQFNPKDQTFINLLAPTPWSGKVDRNFLGDPVGTPRATERIMSILTGGSAIVGGNETDRAYQVLAKTGWTPATQQNNRFHQFGRVERQATPEELTRMQEVRAVELKTRISQLDPATATKRQLDRIEDIANAKSKKSVGIR